MRDMTAAEPAAPASKRRASDKQLQLLIASCHPTEQLHAEIVASWLLRAICSELLERRSSAEPPAAEPAAPASKPLVEQLRSAHADVIRTIGHVMDDDEKGTLYADAADEIERLQRAVTSAMDLLSNGDTEGGARVLRECFWGAAYESPAPEPAAPASKKQLTQDISKSSELRSIGVGRDVYHDRAVILYFNRRPSSRELRELHDHLRHGIDHRFYGGNCDRCGYDPTREYIDE